MDIGTGGATGRKKIPNPPWGHFPQASRDLPSTQTLEDPLIVSPNEKECLMLVGTSNAPSSKPPYFGPRLYKAEAKMPVCFYATLFGTEESLFNFFYRHQNGATTSIFTTNLDSNLEKSPCVLQIAHFFFDKGTFGPDRNNDCLLFPQGDKA